VKQQLLPHGRGYRSGLPRQLIDRYSITAPDSAIAGEKVTISWTVTNSGENDVEGEWTDAVTCQRIRCGLPRSLLGTAVISTIASRADVRTLHEVRSEYLLGLSLKAVAERHTSNLSHHRPDRPSEQHQ